MSREGESSGRVKTTFETLFRDFLGKKVEEDRGSSGFGRPLTGCFRQYDPVNFDDVLDL